MITKWIKKDSKLIKDTEATKIYGPYPKEQPEGRYNIIVPSDKQKNIWVSSFEELIDILRKELANKVL